MAQQSGAEKFNEVLNNYINKEQAVTISSNQALMRFVDKCSKHAKQYEGTEPVAASEFYFLASFSCLFYIEHVEMDEYVFSLGKDYIEESCSILNDDDEYKLFQSLYQVYDLPQNAVDAFGILKRINKLCISFRLIENNIIPTNYLEDLYNDIFCRNLSSVLDELLKLDKQELVIEACYLLLQFPHQLYKLKSYTYLSRVYDIQGHLEEALRNAKLGVDLLGSNIDYDYKNFSHQLWAECWTRVAICNRKKKEFDFAMSLFEKGTDLKIVDCINYLAEMYEAGESEDADHSMAVQLWQKAENIENERIRIETEEKERIKRETEARIAEEMRIAEEARLAEEARQKELKRQETIALLKKIETKWYFIIIALCFFLVLGLSLLNKETILDHAITYEKQGKSVLFIDDKAKKPHLIYMDKDALYYDNLDNVKIFFPVGVEMKTEKISLMTDNSAIKVTKVEDKENALNILSSSKCKITEIIPEKSFLISKDTKISLSSGSVLCGECYLVIKNENDYSVTYIPGGKLNKSDGNWCIQMEVIGSLLPACNKYFKSKFSSTDFGKIYSMGYTTFHTFVDVDLTTSFGFLRGDADFRELHYQIPAHKVGDESCLIDISDEINTHLHGVLSSRQVQKIFGGSEILSIHSSTDNKSTFVVKQDGRDSHDKYGLFKIDNTTKNYSCLDHGMEINFESNYIHVKQYDTFLLIFDDSKDIYYDYSGNKRRK